jgi:adenylate cyclase
MNPGLCNVCEQFAKKFQGGADVELSLLFVDVRGSTSLSKEMDSMRYGRPINRFYKTSTRVLVHSDALIDKIIGDQVTAMYVPGFARPAHARTAVLSAEEILYETGHTHPDGPWIPLGAAVHTGRAFVGFL